jgi:hypothetical protein
MKDILEKLNELKENIDSDIRNEWIDSKDKQDSIRQSSQLAMAIGLLTTLGTNNNIG